MPVTFHPAPYNKVKAFAGATKPTTPSSLLRNVYGRGSKPVVRHIQSSFGHDSEQSISVTPRKNGFVHTVMAAYNQHHALVIRPDDVWLAIVTQFSSFVNGEGRAEQLRYLFVAHEGKKKLTIGLPGWDFGTFAYLMTEKLHENVVDPELREWCLPDFSTTTTQDTVVASVVMMATLKAYFEYGASVACGIPQVTLLGTRDDWAKIFERVDKLGRYGIETAAWRDLLKPVLARFVKSFEPGYAESAENLDFWQRVADEHHRGSGMDYLSGWITAFCVFNNMGKWQGGPQLERYKDGHLPGDTGSANPAEYAFGQVQADLGGGRVPASNVGHIKALTIDGVAYPRLGLKSVPQGTVEVEVTLYDDGQTTDTVMVAGLVGTAASDHVPVATNEPTTGAMISTELATEAGPRGQSSDVVQGGEISPVAAWWIFEV